MGDCDICGCRGDWTPAAFIEEEIAAIRETVGSSRVIGALSGGVDSTVAAALVYRAIGEQLTCIFVDHGLLRKGEREQVTQLLQEHLGMKTILVDARERFLAKLAGVVDPEKKRKIIGHEFIRVFEEEAAHLGEFEFLLQGTIYPDSIAQTSLIFIELAGHDRPDCLKGDLGKHILESLTYSYLFSQNAKHLQVELYAIACGHIQVFAYRAHYFILQSYSLNGQLVSIIKRPAPG
jgi:GMP synthase (glutamine-hydrolysing)